MIIEIPFKTPTINHLYYHRGNIKILKKEARELRKRIYELITPKPELNKPLKVEIEVYENWFTLKNDVKRKDVFNREKFLIDSVFKALEVDDKFIFEITIKKKQSEKEKSIIKINLL